MAVYGRWEDCAAQVAARPGFDTAFAFVARLLDGSLAAARTLQHLKDGDTARLTLDGEGVYAMLQCGTTKPREQQQLESHRRYADVQVVVSGDELMEIAPISELSPAGPFDEDRDLQFYVLPTLSSRLVMRDGMCAVVFPSDGHAPMQAPAGRTSLSRRVVVKVQV